MKITVAGAGYVGLITSIGLAEMGQQVTCIDVQEEKIADLQQGKPSIYEPGLESLLQKNIRNGNLTFTVNPSQAYSGADIIFIAVGTPELPDGSADLKYIFVAAHTIAHHLNQDALICTKSTVPVGTNHLIHDIISGRIPPSIKIDVVSNPEFLREGAGLFDFFHGDRIVLGTDNPEAASIMEQLYLPLKIPIIKTDIKSAELIKYAANAFLAAKISFINEIANICEKVGANVDEVAYAIGQDKRIGSPFLQAGIGYGGSCFPKDTKALVQIAGNLEHPFELLEAVIKVNNRQHHLPVLKAKEIAGPLRGKKTAVLGLAFKPDTDDIREAASLTIIRELQLEGARIIAYDPAGVPNARKIFGDSIKYTEDLKEALQDADLAIIATEWDQIKHAPLNIFTDYMKQPVIIDGRNCYSLNDIEKHGITYLSVGRPPVFASAAIQKPWKLFG